MGTLPLELRHGAQSRAAAGTGCAGGTAATGRVGLDLSLVAAGVSAVRRSSHVAPESLSTLSLTGGAHVTLSLFSVCGGPRVRC